MSGTSKFASKYSLLLLSLFTFISMKFFFNLIELAAYKSRGRNFQAGAIRSKGMPSECCSGPFHCSYECTLWVHILWLCQYQQKLSKETLQGLINSDIYWYYCTTLWLLQCVCWHYDVLFLDKNETTGIWVEARKIEKHWFWKETRGICKYRSSEVITI